MIARALLALLLSLTLFACGVKTELDPPNGAMPDKRQVDQSKPPNPLGQ